MADIRRRVTKKVVKDTHFKVRTTMARKDEVMAFCKENNTTLTDLVDMAITYSMKDDNYSKIAGSK